MTVYVDDMHETALGNYPGRHGTMRMCHMVADTTDELLAMADLIGVDRRWIQHPGTPGDHFDIATTKRSLAVANGAVETTMRELAHWTYNRDDPTARPTPTTPTLF